MVEGICIKIVFIRFVVNNYGASRWNYNYNNYLIDYDKRAWNDSRD